MHDLAPPTHNAYKHFYGNNPRDLSEDRNVGLQIRRLQATMRRIIDCKVCPLGLTAHQWRPLLLICHLGINTPAELARTLGIDTSAVTRTLDRLEAKDFLRRTRVAEDRRVVRIVPTELGQTVSAQILPLIAETLNLHLEGFSDAEFRMLISLLRRMIANGERCLQQQQSIKK